MVSLYEGKNGTGRLTQDGEQLLAEMLLRLSFEQVADKLNTGEFYKKLKPGFDRFGVSVADEHQIDKDIRECFGFNGKIYIFCRLSGLSRTFPTKKQEDM